MKNATLALGLSVGAILSTVSVAKADIFSGTHSKLGTVNLSMNSAHSTARSAMSGNSGVSYYYGIRFNDVIAWGQGESSGESFNARKGGTRVSDTDNKGNICTGKLNRSWWGEDLKIRITYDSDAQCPFAGKAYEVHLKKQSKNIGFIVGGRENPEQKIWMNSDSSGKRSSRYVLPGDLVKIGSSRRIFTQVQLNGVIGWLDYTQFLRNQEYASWGV